MTTVIGLLGMAAWGFVGMWERSRLLESKAADIARSSVLTAFFDIGDTRMRSDMLALRVPEDQWFWTQFGQPIKPHQICAALLPPGTAIPTGLSYAGSQMVLAAAALQARPGASHSYILDAMHQAFLAETLLAGGVAVTRLQAELLRPGMAITAASTLIDGISPELASMRAIDTLLLKRSQLLSGDW